MKHWRHIFIISLFLICCSAILLRVGYLNVNEKEFLQSQGDARSIRSKVIPAYRGVIYDRYGEPLAVSSPVFSVWTDPSEKTLVNTDISELARILDLEETSLIKKLRNNSSKEFLWLRRRLPWSTADKIRDLDLDGLYFRSEYKRYYPAGEVASHVVGMTNIDGKGLEGVELIFDHILRGTSGKKIVLQNERGEIIKDLDYLSSPQFGQDLHLSLDLRLQFVAYRELKAAVEANQALSGSLVMLDAETGEILALVNQPSYNPNELQTDYIFGLKNRAVTDTYEPGSTIKPFTIMAALESAEYSAASQIDTAPGFFKVGGKLIEDPVDRGTLSLGEVLKVSSQVGIAKVALALDEDAVYQVLVRAGIDEYIGAGLPGEAQSLIDNSQLSNPIVRATLAYGYGLAISPLQLAQAYLTLASEGLRVPVNVVRQDSPAEERRVFEKTTSSQVVRMMETVTDDTGTAPKARVSGYRVAGKTGTARKVGADGYDDERHVAIFAGMAPASSSKVVLVVVINEPQGLSRGGGEVAAPVFGRVMARSLRLLGVEPDAPGRSA